MRTQKALSHSLTLHKGKYSLSFRDNRGGKIVIVAHCILNQNSRVLGLANNPAAIDEIVDTCRKYQVAFLQMPCPELIFGGARRPARTKEEYDKPSYRRHCRQIAISIVRQAKKFTEDRVQVIAVIGMDGSPSCGVSDSETGILIEELLSELENEEFVIPTGSINTLRIRGDIKWLEDILSKS